MAVPYTFGSATAAIPLSQLDSNFATTITLGNTAVQLGNTITNLTGVSNLASASALSLGSNGNTTAVTIDTSQNVGIGTSSPSYKLDVVGAFSGSSVLSRVYNSDTGATSAAQLLTNTGGGVSTALFSYGTSAGYVGTTSNHPSAFITNNIERMRIDSSGNVGIGTSSPSYKLEVKGAQLGGTAGNSVSYVRLNGDANGNADYLETVQLRTTTGSGWSTAEWRIRRNVDNTATQSAIGFGGDNTVIFYTNGTERARIDSSGNLLVGTTSQVGFNGGAGANINANGAFRNGVSGSGDSSAWQRSSTGNYLAFFYGALNSNPSAVGSINTNGTNTTYSTSSDYRLKKDVQPMTGALAKVVALKPVTYTWKANGSSGEGFIAHELQAVVPDAVIGEKDAVDKEGNIQPQGVDYSKIVVHLVAAIQEQQAMITALTARIAALEAK